jgi:pimeloyl-ACP methyl ester carboxylesterase
VSEELARRQAEPIPHWPGRLISLGDHDVYLRSVSPGSVSPGSVSPGSVSPGSVSPGRAPSGEAEPALFVHGLEGSSRNWTDLMDLLSPRLDCDAVDLPGFGDSPPRPDGRYCVAAQTQTLIALIERRHRGPVHLIGNSLSGPACVKVAASRPGLIRTLTLISPALPDSRPRLDLLRFPVMCVPGVGTRLVRQVRMLPPERRVADVIATCYSDPGLFAPERFAAEVAELARRDALDWPPAALVGSARALTAEFFRFGRASTWRAAARVSAPVLVIYGGDDRLVHARMAGRAAAAFSSARIVVLPRTGHLAHMEHPHLVAAEIGSLLAAVRSAQGPGGPGNSRSLAPVDEQVSREEIPRPVR